MEDSSYEERASDPGTPKEIICRHDSASTDSGVHRYPLNQYDEEEADEPLIEQSLLQDGITTVKRPSYCRKTQRAHHVTISIPKLILGSLLVSVGIVLHRKLISSEESHQKISLNAPMYLNSTTAYELLESSLGDHNSAHDFFLLQNGLDTQYNQAYCGVASVAALINSLGGQRRVGFDENPKRQSAPNGFMMQEDVFNECTASTVIYRDDEFDGIFAFPSGLTLKQTSNMLECHLPKEDWAVDTHHVDPSQISINTMRHDLISALRSNDSRVIVNFQRSSLGQSGEGGHFSPVGAYSAMADAFLIVDVAKYKYPPFWVSASQLYSAMATTDSCGVWNFPSGQIDLPDGQLFPKTPIQSKRAYDALECQPLFRGYTITSPR